MRHVPHTGCCGERQEIFGGLLTAMLRRHSHEASRAESKAQAAPMEERMALASALARVRDRIVPFGEGQLRAAARRLQALAPAPPQPATPATPPSHAVYNRSTQGEVLDWVGSRRCRRRAADVFGDAKGASSVRPPAHVPAAAVDVAMTICGNDVAPLAEAAIRRWSLLDCH